MVNSKYIAAFQQVVDAITRVFPFTDYKERRRFERRVRKLQPRVALLRSDQDFFNALEVFIGELHHGHTRLDTYPGKQWFGPPNVSVRRIKGKYYLWSKNKPSGRIIRIDRATPESLLKMHRRRLKNYRPTYQTHQALKFLLLDRDQKKIRLTLRQDGSTRTRTLPRRKVRPLMVVQPKIESNDGILYVFIPSWNPYQITFQFIRVLVQRAQDALGIIIDLRENGGGSTQPAFELAGHFFRHAVSFGQVVYRESASSFRLKRRSLMVAPRRPYLSIPIRILTSLESQSSAEIFVAGLIDQGRAVSYGATTAGSSGNPVRVIIPFGRQSFTIKIATWKYRRPNRKWLERRGLQPDHQISGSSRLIDRTFLAAKRSILKHRRISKK